jgi:hypothetical protein
MEIGFVSIGIVFFQQHRFGDENITAIFDTIDRFDKMRTKQALGSVSPYCVSQFFARYKSDMSISALLIKENEERCMPDFGRFFVDVIELLSRLDAAKLLYTANRFLPLALLAAITFRPFFVFILALNPWVRFLGVLWG